MKNSVQKLVINDIHENHRLDRFVEEICDLHNITNEYFGNILLATSEAAEVLFSINTGEEESSLTVSFEKCSKGLRFKLKLNESQGGENEDEDLLEREIRRHRLCRDLYIIKALADELEISANGKGITLIFHVTSINFEKSLERVQLLKDFWEKEKNVIHEN